MRKTWTKQEEDLLFSLYKEKTLDELSEILEKTKEQIKSKGYRHKINFMNYWTETQDNYLIHNYQNMTYQQMGDNIGRSRSAVQSRCRKLNLMKGYASFKKSLNSNFFSEINTEEKAYWLGFICADGCVSWNKTKNAYSFKITLQASDKDFLSKFITAIDGQFSVKLKTTRVKFNGIYKDYDICEVSFSDKVFISDLLKYFTTNKTDYLRIPTQIPQNLIRHFIRGFSDGDGCFYCNPKKRDKSFEIVGKCRDMLEDIRDELIQNGISSQIYQKRKTNWKLGIYKLNELIKFQSYLYKDATIFMKRKFIKSQEILNLAS